MTKPCTLTNAHRYIMHALGISQKEADKIYKLLCISDMDGDTDLQERRVDAYLTRLEQGHKKIYAAGLAIEATG